MRLSYRFLLLCALAVFPPELPAGSALPDNGSAGPRLSEALAEEDGASSTVNIFYFDATYAVIVDVSVSGIEKLLSVSSDSVKLERIESFLTYTNGKIFVLNFPPELTSEKLEKGVSYGEISETSAVSEARSLLVQYPAADLNLNAEIRRYMRPVPAETPGIKVLRGKSRDGTEFEAVSVEGESSANNWATTMAARYYVRVKGKPAVFTIFGRPMEAVNLLNTARKRINRNKGDTLLSLRLTGIRGFDILDVAPSRVFNYLGELGTDIAAFDVSDFRFVWNGLNSADYRQGNTVFLCSNVELPEGSAREYIKPYVIKNINGVKVGFLSLIPEGSISPANAPGIRAVATPPLSSAAETAGKLKENGDVDLILAVSHLTPEEFGRLTVEVPAIDVIIGPVETHISSSRKNSVELQNWKAEIHGYPAFVALRSANALGKITAGFTIGGESPVLKSISSETILPESSDYDCGDGKCGDKEKLLKSIVTRGDILLPDPRNVWPDLQSKLQYNGRDFFNLAAGVIRRLTEAEVSFARVRKLRSNSWGEVPSGYVENWLGQEEKLVKAVMPGSALRQLASNFDFSPVGGWEWLSSPKYRAGNLLAVSGMDKTGRISGLPVADNEMYKVVFPEDILRDADKYPGLKSAKVTGYSDSTYNKIVLDWLRARKEKASGPGEQKDYEALVRELVENRPKNPSGWRINLRNAALQFVNTQAGNPDDFSGIADSRIRTVNQTLMQGSGKIFSEYYREKIRIDTGLSADYGKVTLRPKNQGAVETESIDQILAENEFRYQAFKWNGFMGGAVLGPFANIAYDTEFTPQSSLPLRRILRSRAGIKLFEGLRLQEFYFGGVTEQDYTFADTRTKYAWETGFKFNVPIPSTSFTFYAQGYYRDFTRSRFDNLSDIKNTLELNTKISAKLYGDVMLSPFLNYYRVTGKLTQGSAHNLTFGVALEYARLFKLKH